MVQVKYQVAGLDKRSCGNFLAPWRWDCTEDNLTQMVCFTIGKKAKWCALIPWAWPLSCALLHFGLWNNNCDFEFGNVWPSKRLKLTWLFANKTIWLILADPFKFQKELVHVRQRREIGHDSTGAHSDNSEAETWLHHELFNEGISIKAGPNVPLYLISAT